MSNIQRSLITYAFLADARRVGDDLLSGLMPIFKPIAKEHQGQKFEPKKFTAIVREYYGLDITDWAIEGLAPRLEKAGVLTKIKIDDHTHEYSYSEIEEEYTTTTEADIQLILNSFSEFAAPLVQNKEEGSLSKELLQEEFLSYMVDMNFVGIIARPEIHISSDGKEKLGLTKNQEQIDWENDKARKARIETLCASFVVELSKKEPHLFELLTRITAGALVSEVILNFQNPETGISLERLHVYLDAPFLMNLLDLGNTACHTAAKSIFDQLREHGAKVSVFAHSVDELKENLTAVLSNHEAGNSYGPTARRLGNRTFKAYATSLKNSAETRIRQEGIWITKGPSGATPYTYFSGEAEERLCDSLGHYQRALAKERDAASIANIVRLRCGHTANKSSFHECNSLFLTSNSALAKNSQKTLIEMGVYKPNEVPATISDRDIAGLLWVIYGGAASEIPIQVLLAHCATAIEPKADLVAKMHTFLAKVEPAQKEFFSALMTSERSAQYLSQYSLGDSRLVTEENFSDILDQMKLTLTEEQAIEHEKKTLELIEKHQQEIERKSAESEQRISQLQNKNKFSELQIKKLSMEADEEKAARLATENKINELTASINLEKQQRLEEKKLRISSALSKVGTQSRNLKICIAVLLLLPGAISGIIAFLTGEIWAQVITAILTILGSAACFWDIPAALFGGRLIKWRKNKLTAQLAEIGLSEADLDTFELNWDNYTVEVKQSK